MTDNVWNRYPETTPTADGEYRVVCEGGAPPRAHWSNDNGWYMLVRNEQGWIVREWLSDVRWWAGPLAQTRRP